MKAIIQKEKFWEELQVQVDIFKPIVRVLRLVDSDLPTTGKVYHAMYVCQEELKDVNYGGTQRFTVTHTVNGVQRPENLSFTANQKRK